MRYWRRLKKKKTKKTQIYINKAWRWWDFFGWLFIFFSTLHQLVVYTKYFKNDAFDSFFSPGLQLLYSLKANRSGTFSRTTVSSTTSVALELWNLTKNTHTKTKLDKKQPDLYKPVTLTYWLSRQIKQMGKENTDSIIAHILHTW